MGARVSATELEADCGEPQVPCPAAEFLGSVVTCQASLHHSPRGRPCPHITDVELARGGCWEPSSPQSLSQVFSRVSLPSKRHTPGDYQAGEQLGLNRAGSTAELSLAFHGPCGVASCLPQNLELLGMRQKCAGYQAVCTREHQCSLLHKPVKPATCLFGASQRCK